MKKLLTVAAMVLMFASAGAFAADNWSVKLAFSSAAASDVMEVTIGEGDVSEMLKPPPLPGSAVTGDSSNAIVNAYAYMSATGRKVAKSIIAPDETATARIWEIQVEAEETGPVYVQGDFTNAGSNSLTKYFIIDGDTAAKTEISSSNTAPVAVYTSTGGTKTLFAMVGTSETFAIVKSDGGVLGGVKQDVSELDSQAGIGVYLNGSGSTCATSAADGSFTCAGFTSGKLTLDAERTLPSTVNVTVPSSGVVAVTLPDIRHCDFDNDGYNCNFQDFKILKTAYKAKDGVEDEDGNLYYDVRADVNGDGEVNFQDFKALKSYYKVSVTE